MQERALKTLAHLSQAPSLAQPLTPGANIVLHLPRHLRRTSATCAAHPRRPPETPSPTSLLRATHTARAILQSPLPPVSIPPRAIAHGADLRPLGSTKPPAPEPSFDNQCRRATAPSPA
ncbi:hypothetical protein U1Q18_044384 [Sarracenia purpurea var. burkii]